MGDYPSFIFMNPPGNCVVPRTRSKHWERFCVLMGPRVDSEWTLTLFSTEWSGINALLYYGPTLIQDIGLKGDTVSLVVSGGIGIVQFIAVLPAIAYIDSVGRKALLRG